MKEVILGFELHTPLGFCTPLKGKRLDCMIKLIATDMDGTFLRADGSYDKERFARLLDRLRDAGYLFVAASGRSLLTLKELFQGFEHQMAFIAENGCIVEYDGQILFETKLSPEDYGLILDELDNHPDCQGYLLSGIKGAYLPLTSSEEYVRLASHFYANVQKAGLTSVADSIVKVSAHCRYDKVHDLVALLNARLPHFRAVVTGFDGFDVIPAAYNKSTALALLCETLNLSAEVVYAFGDNHNDLEMLAFAGTAIVPDNAIEAAKQLATEVIGDHSTDAVLTYLESLVSDDKD